MAEDTLAGQVQAFLDNKKGKEANVTCSKEVYAAIHGKDRVPEKHETNEICDVLNTSIVGWSRWKFPLMKIKEIRNKP